jgi:MFS family permease
MTLPDPPSNSGAPVDDKGDRTSVQPIGAMSLVVDREFQKLWTIGVLMGAMRWLEMLAIGVWVYAETESPVLVALMTVLRMLPMAMFGTFTGAIADRIDRRLILIGCMMTMAGVTAVLSVLAWFGMLEIWQVGLGAFINGLCWSTDFPVRRTILGESVGHARLGPAMSMDSASNNATRMIGPLAGGALFAAVGMAGAYAVAATFYAVAGLLSVTLVYRQVKGPPRTTKLFAEIGEGIAYLRQNRALMGHLGVTIIVNLFAFPYAAMAPVVGSETFAVSPVLIGLMMASEGAGAFVGAMLLAFLATPSRFRLIYVLGSGLFILCILLFSLVDVYEMGVLILVVGGFGIAGFAAMQSAIMFSEAPSEIRSRLMGVLSVCIGAGPIGVMHVGWLASMMGGSTALTVIAIEGVVALGILIMKFPELRR